MKFSKKIFSVLTLMLAVFTLAFTTPGAFAADVGTNGSFYNYTGSSNGGTGLYLAYQGTNLQWPANSITSSDNLTKDIALYNSAATSATWTFYRGTETTPFFSKTGKVLTISYGDWQYFQSTGSTPIVIKINNIQYDYSAGMSISLSPSGAFAGKLMVMYNSSSTIPKSLVNRPFQVDISTYASNAISATWKVYDRAVSTTVPVRELTGKSILSEGGWGNVFTGDLGIVIENIVYADNERPAISGQETFVTSVADARPISFFQAYLSAYDERDGDLTDDIYIITDNYTPNKSTLGNYQVTFGVSDEAGNLATLIVNITVADVTKPIITGNSSDIEMSYTQTWNISAFRSTLAVTDNYDVMTNSDITVKSDNYTANKTVLGTYEVVFTATDNSGNEGTFIKRIKVIDDIPPTFTGPSVIQKPATSILTVNDIKAQLSASDVKDGNRTSAITIKTDNFTGYGSILGSYQIVFEVTDTKGNVATHTVTVNVIDDIAPIWFIKDGVSIILEQPSQISRQQIIDLLIATGQLTVGQTSSIEFFLNEYEGNEQTPGVYLVGIETKDTAGNQNVFNLAITVLENEDDVIIVEPDPIEDFWQDIQEWIEGNQEIAIGVGVVFGLIVLIGVLVIIAKFRRPKNKKRRR